MDKTHIIKAVPKDTDEKLLKSMKDDYNKIVKFLIRQTYTDKKLEDLHSWKVLKTMDFWKFLYEVGMFTENKKLECYTNAEKNQPRQDILKQLLHKFVELLQFF